MVGLYSLSETKIILLFLSMPNEVGLTSKKLTCFLSLPLEISSG
jgi:hypothetical protein